MILVVLAVLYCVYTYIVYSCVRSGSTSHKYMCCIVVAMCAIMLLSHSLFNHNVPTRMIFTCVKMCTVIAHYVCYVDVGVCQCLTLHHCVSWDCTYVSATLWHVVYICAKNCANQYIHFTNQTIVVTVLMCVANLATQLSSDYCWVC